MKRYNHSEIEKKWQKTWQQKKIFQAKDFSKKPKKYVLVEFPYPSGEGLHMGHVRPYTAGDVYSRYMRLQGHEVLYPIGWDAFGLPAENFAIKKGVHPSVTTKRNIANAKRQIQSWGLSFDWSREVNTTDPGYYKWTQWLFLQFYKAGLAYEATGLINWCPKDKTGLANEEVIDGKCERCGSEVEKKELRQWHLKITDYAEKLLAGLKELPQWPEAVKLQQENWIGKSMGAEIHFPIEFENGNPNFLLLHGFGGSPTANFFPWLKQRLEQQGFAVQVPPLPNTDRPAEAEQVQFVLNNCTIDENTVIVGHSLGAVVAMKVVQRLHSHVAGMVLAGGFVSPNFKDHDRIFEKTFDWHFDFSNIRNKTGYIKLLHATNDYAVSDDQAGELSEALQVPLQRCKAEEEHFTAAEEPQIFRYATPSIQVFTTRPDTIFGATYMVLAPEHPLIENWKLKIENWNEVRKYIEKTQGKQERERAAAAEKEKTGVQLKGVSAINPASGERIPVWIADYVLSGYGTGAIMAVPAHDERDFAFAKKYNLPIREVIAEETGTPKAGEERRDGGCGIIFDPKSQKYAVATSSDGLVRLFAGGVEDGEDLQSAVLRELTEESGLYDFGHVEKIKTCFAHFHNRRKNIDRAALATCFLVLLNSTKVKATNLQDHEQDLHLSWMSAAEIRDNWRQRNKDGGLDHWMKFLSQAVARAIELGADTTSDANVFQATASISEGVLIDSDIFTGQKSLQALRTMAATYGTLAVQYKLRDWVFSRQRYWGEPIPIIHCKKCGIVPVPDKDLPVKLPTVKKYQPTGTGESPLAAIRKWVHVKCPKCKSAAKRETNTMPQWAGSSWYYLRYVDPRNKTKFADSKKQRYWTPVDLYFGGMEHTTLHLLYSRFWNLFLYDQKLVTAQEPYKVRKPHGIILAADGEKMSKSRGNVVNPDEIVKQYGADTLRMYELFLGPHEAQVSWSDQGILGVRRYLERVWIWVHELAEAPHEKIKKSEEQKDGRSNGQKIASKAKDTEKVERALHRLIKKVTEDIENFRFNTVVSALMEFHNEIKQEFITVDSLRKFLVVLYPYAPHMAEELNAVLGGKRSLQLEAWPKFDESKIRESTVEIVVQINGKVKGTVVSPLNSTQDAVEELALALPPVKTVATKNDVIRVIYVPNKLINLVI